MKEVLIIICGGVASYKAISITSMLVKKNISVNVIMTKNACQFISPLILESLIGRKIYTDLFEDPLAHIHLSKTVDAILVVPTTYNIIGKIRSGVADDLATCVLSANTKPVFFALAMNSNMYQNPIFQDNMNYLKNLMENYYFIDPENGFLACGEYNIGRLQNEDFILNYIEQTLEAKKLSLCNLKNKKIVITGGSTVSYLDPVRFISNHSSGKMAWSIAYQAYLQSAQIVLIMGINQMPTLPSHIQIVNVSTALEMYQVAEHHFNDTDIFIGCAAVTDFILDNPSSTKIKKNSESLTLSFKPSIDILKTLSFKKKNHFMVGFSLETSDLYTNALNKLKDKNLDLIIANETSNQGTDDGTIHLIDGVQEVQTITASKKILATHILKNIHDKIIS